ncbi:MAG: glutamate--cysteine ligase [Immundisolibacteraceae bacterium]|nr:glutamate--cysteine ligase [Immundisolibacteraceae bacterium]
MALLNESALRKVLATLSSIELSGGLRGIEKESLRVSVDGALSTRFHPQKLGSKLTHSEITTDYSEALLELITQPLSSSAELIDRLHDIHTFVYQGIGDEMLWATSMPCAVQDQNSIPIADYGSSNVGRMKHVYRHGLAWRYGRVMQAIAGVHFNYSVPESAWPALHAQEGSQLSLDSFISDRYFGLIRNFQRVGWLIPYLFGASPAICKSFTGGDPGQFEVFDSGTYFKPYATALRMSDIGYKNSQQANLGISYNSLDEYVAGLTRAIDTPAAEYEKFGVCVDGEYRQLNANVLQIENEYYSFIRPKQIAESGEKPTLALSRRGVRYVEVRALDVSVHDPAGVSEDALKFIEALLLYCLLSPSDPIDEAARQQIESNQTAVAINGRDPALVLHNGDQQITLREWGRELLAALQPICTSLDAAGEGGYGHALMLQMAKMEDAELTPSARILTDMRVREESFYQFALRRSKEWARYFTDQTLSADLTDEFTQRAKLSLRQQAELEAQPQVPFEQYLQNYFAQK